MAIISMFYGLIVSMYYLDNKKHHLPHIHVKYQDQEAVFSIESGEILEGELPPNKRKLVEAWIEIHKEDLFANWSLAIAGQTLFTIEPLK
jgi:desulfoferrodoxin (superoxide reductase-like protein)